MVSGKRLFSDPSSRPSGLDHDSTNRSGTEGLTLQLFYRARWRWEDNTAVSARERDSRALRKAAAEGQWSGVPAGNVLFVFPSIWLFPYVKICEVPPEANTLLLPVIVEYPTRT